MVLKYLSGCTAPVAGIDVSADLDWVATSSVYAAISALQARGQINAKWDHSASHPRRMISLNDLGAETLRQAEIIEQRLSKPGKSRSGPSRTQEA
ncbi:MAG: hypothetical protein O3B95_01095 [Chloroflexi bacterium]|nr:hypothetical protein [Chloroflexota bacterium]